MGKRIEAAPRTATWYAIRVRANQRCVTGAAYRDPASAPFIVEHLLRRKGFEVFVPRRTVFRFSNGVTVRKRVKREVPRQLLPGWLFVAMDGNRWRDLSETPGVVGVAGQDGKPLGIAEERLRTMAKKWGDGFLTAPERERFMRSRVEYAPGQRVRIADGNLADMIVTVVEVTGRNARVLLPLFGMDRTVEIDAMLLEAA